MLQLVGEMPHYLKNSLTTSDKLRHIGHQLAYVKFVRENPFSEFKLETSEQSTLVDEKSISVENLACVGAGDHASVRIGICRVL